MAFCFKRKESMARAIPRLGSERILDALECLKACKQAEAIHCARKDIKKARSLLGLAQASISKKDFRRIGKLLREAARGLAGPRDAYVKVEAVKALSRHYKGPLRPGAFRQTRARLKHAADVEIRRFSRKHRAKEVRRILRRAGKEFERLDICAKGWKAIGPGIKATYSKGRHAYETALIHQTPENFHEWRKHAKDLWYQAALLHPIWPEQMDALAKELELLGEYLGNDHDLFLLQQTLQKSFSPEDAQQTHELLHNLAQERQSELRRLALAVGKRLYAQKTSTFCQRLERYWRAWRREKAPIQNALPMTMA